MQVELTEEEKELLSSPELILNRFWWETKLNKKWLSIIINTLLTDRYNKGKEDIISWIQKLADVEKSDTEILYDILHFITNQ
jgi:hypothetical protein